MPTQIQSSDITSGAFRFITEEIPSSGSYIRDFDISYAPIGFSNCLGHSKIMWTSVGLSNPYSVSEVSGVFYVSGDGNVIRRFNADNTIDVICGTHGSSGFSGDGGPAISGLITTAKYVVPGPSGSLYFYDSDNSRVRKIDANGILSTVAGNGNNSFSVGTCGNGGPALSGSFSNVVNGLSVADNGDIYVADTNLSSIRRIKNGIIDIVAGSGSSSYPGDGYPAVGYSLLNYSDVFCSGDSFYMTCNQMLIKVNSSGLMTKIAGSYNTQGYNGDNIAASGALLTYPASCTVDISGNVYMSEGFNGSYNRIRKIDTNGIITTFMGTGSNGYSGDGGPASGASFGMTSLGNNHLTSDLNGNVYLADSYNYRIRKIDTSNNVNTIIGWGNSNYTQGEYLINSIYIPNQFITNPIENTDGLVKYTLISGLSIQVNLSGMGNISSDSIDKFYIGYTTNQ